MRGALEQTAKILRESEYIVFLGGAGVPTASGIPDFRSAARLYSRNMGFLYPPEVFLSREFFESRPAQFYDFLREYLVYPDAKPNPVH